MDDVTAMESLWTTNPGQVLRTVGAIFSSRVRTLVAHGSESVDQYIKQHPAEPEPANSLEATKQPRRWVVERLFFWFNRSRRLLIRWEKLSAPYEAFLKLACALICFHQCDRLSVFG